MTYGELARRTATVAAAKGVRTIHANNYEEIAGFLAKAAQPGDAVLFKGSRAMALEKRRGADEGAAGRRSRRPGRSERERRLNRPIGDNLT